MSYLGDFALESTFDLKFCTVQASGAPTVLAGTPVISIYPDNSVTQLTAGITLSVDFDSVVGLNNVRVVATAANGYAAATNYAVVITTGTVNSVSAVGYVVGHFSLAARSALRPTTAGRTLDVSAGGEAGLDMANVSALPAGAVPHLAVAENGTAQSATATTLVMRAGATHADDTLKGCLVGAFGSTQGYWQFRWVDSNTLTDDTLTVQTWTVTPSGTITYQVFGSAPASSALPITSNVVEFDGNAVVTTGGIPNVNTADADAAVITAVQAGLATPTNITAGIITTVTNLTELSGVLPDSIPADGTAPSIKQALYMLTQFMTERSVTSTTVTVAKPDGTTSLFTLTLNDATTPTSITRAT